VKPPPDFRTLTDADWKRELPRARAYRNEVQSEIRERLERLSTPMSPPKPYYKDSAVTLYHGDCREIVPHLGRFDLLLTDPPYILSDSPPGDSHYGMSLSKFEGSDYCDLTVGFNHEELFGSARKLMDKFNAFCFCSNKQISRLMAWGEANGFATALLVWNKVNSAPFANGVWRGDAEFCIHIREPGAYFQGNAELKRKVVQLPCVQDSAHPTVKPLELILRYVEIGSEVGQTVLDPFAGSGTTGRACKDLGRKCVMIEREERYCEVIARRMGQEVLAL
jgi:site-specific DNA-methyltransferase (adenine-specific)